MSSIEQAQLVVVPVEPQKLAAGDAAPWPLWRFVGAFLLVALCILITRHPWETMVSISLSDEEASHVMLVPVALLWIIFSRRERLSGITPKHTWIGPVVIAIGWASLVYGYDIRDNEYWFFGAILMAVGSLLSFIGAQAAWRLLPAFIVLGFLIPMPAYFREQISLPLQGVMAQLTQHLGDIFGFMIGRSGNVLMINGQAVEIAEACNGMRMVFALFLVGYTVAFATPLKTYARVLVLLSAPLFALLCNLLRMLPTVWLYGNASHDVAEGFHDAAGWIMVILAYFMMMGMLHLIEWTGIPVMQGDTTTGAPGAPGAPGAAA